MNKRACVIFKVLMNRYHTSDVRPFLSILPLEEAKEVASQKILSKDLGPILGQPCTVTAKIHYSWLQPLINTFPEPLKRVTVASLTQEQKMGFQFSSLPLVSSSIKNFLLSHLYGLLGMNHHLPIEYLPQSELNALAHLNKLDLMALIDLLGLYDLASEVRKIVDRNQLKNVFGCLSAKQAHYLKACMNQKDQLVVQKLGLDFTKQDCSLFMKVIHKRGIVRLSRALLGEHEDLVWHIAHILDSGRGNILLKEHASSVLSKVTDVLKQQVMTTLNFLKT